ncbi:GTP cyclohydrolase I FolE [Pseudobacteriovorax antillogorgiicola]|uniref:GTP cyclohydrolase 1 n=1 Tax=Pseudobacteriovorax antillogorgiicola TaxID=1513793 RepID=A0A1Y6CNI3_9BACT|nr:GTP cyclohydrolase I FolE [Pseudobacteriovorax antillogorgiicola]TCS43624.1 GTP cyclohydrolase I [Pseudobacteriovorax antillogorgiicola]SMF80019.1 GTP cyclohydrolase I [Pseudobacteriovorax antillogorgiicola]
MDDKTYDQHRQNFTKLLEDLGEKPSRDGLVKTPDRYLQSIQFLTSGYEEDIPTILNDALFDVEYQDMVIVRNIEFYSLCEHHVIPFYGQVHVGYIPGKRVVGLSKIPRLVDVFARRLQVQERMTNQIAACLQEYLEPEGVGVVIDAYHLCMMMRGVEKQKSYTTTSSMHGCFRNVDTRQEFLKLIHSPRRDF